MNNYQQSYPLAGQTILITRAVSANKEFRQMLEAKGAVVLEFPALVIKPPSSWQKLDTAIMNIDQYDWLILTSANGVEYFWQRLCYLNKDKSILNHLKIAVVGTKTAEFLEKYQLKPDYIPSNFVADSLVENFPESLLNKNILFPRVETGGREVLVEELSQKGANITEIPAYQSGCPDSIDQTAWDALYNGIISIITFASSKTVRNFYHLVSQNLKHYSDLTLETLLEDIAIASIGPQTSITCRELLKRVDIEAKEYTLSGLTEEIVYYSMR